MEYITLNKRTATDIWLALIQLAGVEEYAGLDAEHIRRRAAELEAALDADLRAA